VLGKGRLDEDAVDGGVGVELVDDGEQFVLRDGDRWQDDAAGDTDLGGGLFLFGDVRNGRRVVADADEGKAGLAARELGDFGL
jgi:hypothetical protein